MNNLFMNINDADFSWEMGTWEFLNQKTQPENLTYKNKTKIMNLKRTKLMHLICLVSALIILECKLYSFIFKSNQTILV